MPIAKIVYPFQQTGTAWLRGRTYGILGDDPGLGKTIQAVNAAYAIGAKNALVVCPAVGRSVWAYEAEKWAYYEPQVLKTREEIALYFNLGMQGFAIISYEGACWLAGLIRKSPLRMVWDVVIVDEAHYLKTANTERTRAVYAHIWLRAGRLWALSGTIMPAHPGELYPHLKIMGVWDGNKAEFITAFCKVRVDPMWGEQIVGAKRENAPLLKDMLDQIQLRRRKEDVLPELPPMSWNYVPLDVKAPPPDMEIDPETLSERDSVAHATWRKECGVRKAPAVGEYVQSLLDGGEPAVVVFAYHRQVIDMLARQLGAAAITGSTSPAKRDLFIKAFQAGDVKVLIGQITAAGTVITLTAAARVVFAEQSWTPGENFQAAMRTHRIGQTRGVNVDICTAEGVDAAIGKSLIRKIEDISLISA